ncbi:MAG: N-acetylmuramoyl-L-alanine amidase [Anaerolineae bacterium]|nr:N-acetylmuramoyl-L-alanine amidase [Anaerolineae bacterium]
MRRCRSARGAGITYHFLITGDGTIFQTNALDTVSEQTVTPAVNADGVAVAFAGNFTDVPPTAAQISSGARLVAWLLQELKLTADVVVGRSELENVGSPGRQWLMGARWKEILLQAMQQRSVLHHGPLAAARLRHSPDNGVDARLLHHPWPDSLLDELARDWARIWSAAWRLQRAARILARSQPPLWHLCHSSLARRQDRRCHSFLSQRTFAAHGAFFGRPTRQLVLASGEADDPANTLFIQCIEMGAPTFQSGLLALSDENNEDATATSARHRHSLSPGAGDMGQRTGMGATASRRRSRPGHHLWPGKEAVDAPSGKSSAFVHAKNCRRCRGLPRSCRCSRIRPIRPA